MARFSTGGATIEIVVIVLLAVEGWQHCMGALSRVVPSEYLEGHNQARLGLGAAGLVALVWDPQVASYAASVALKKQQSGTCRQLSRSGGPYGENLFWGSGKAWTGREAVTQWVTSRSFYDHDTNTCQEGKQCGQYTQIVWRNTRRLGCASATCVADGNSTFIICSYDPPGNFVGQSPY